MTENERVRIIRKSEKLTLEEFGKRLGVGKSAISDIERGRNSLSDQMCRSICREFGVREEWLRTGDGPMKAPEPSEDDLDGVLDKWGLPREFRGLFLAYRDLNSDGEREAVRQFIRDAAARFAREEAASELTGPVETPETDEDAIPLSRAEIEEKVEEYRALLEKGRSVRFALGYGTPPQTKVSGDMFSSGGGDAG